ncbi:hypothetical protein O181_100128, partial [Austropuccinia psidii MF-1]|nr:hypothetical protein [Austropuccinia psidii MF-1]
AHEEEEVPMPRRQLNGSGKKSCGSYFPSLKAEKAILGSGNFSKSKGDESCEKEAREGLEEGSLVEAKAQSNKDVLQKAGEGLPKVILSISSAGKAFMNSSKQDP